MIIQYEQADADLQELNENSQDHYYWEGWTICRFKPDPVAIWNKDGVYLKDFGWGTVTRYDVSQDGQWHIDS